MKVLHVIDSGGLYGAEVMLLNLVAEQVRQGLDPVIASIGELHIAEKPLEAEAARRGLRVVKFRMRSGPNIAGALKVLRFARQEKIDLLHSHGYKGNILFGLLPRPVRRLPMVTTLHGWTTSTGGLSKMALYEWLDSLSLGFIDRVVLVNKAMRENGKLSGRVSSKCLVVNNGIPLQGDVLVSEASLDQGIVEFCRGGYTIGAIGRLSPEKGYDILLEAMKELSIENPEIRLVILGEGGERGALEARIAKLGLEDRVLMPGYVADAKSYLSLFQVFALSSLTEGLPIVILEAMQAGVPIVATRVGGVPHVLEEGKAGMLVSPSDPAGLAEAVRMLINNPSERDQLAECGKRVVKEKYSSSSMAHCYLGVYDELLGTSANVCKVGRENPSEY